MERGRRPRRARLPGVSILPDVLRPGLDVVFCGTAAGHASARAGAYYAGPGNRFWEILFEIGLTPRRLEPHEFREVLDYGIGLTDAVKTASGPDAALPACAFDPQRLRRLVLELEPAALAFNGKRSARSVLDSANVEYGRRPGRLGSSAVFVLPSTSGAARGFWEPRYWHELAAFVRGEPG